MRIAILIIIVIVFGCTADINDQKIIKIHNNIYATHFAGIDGYSLSIKVSKNGYTLVANTCIVSVSYREDADWIIAKQIDNFHSIDTFFLKISKKNIDTITSLKYYQLNLNCENHIVLL